MKLTRTALRKERRRGRLVTALGVGCLLLGIGAGPSRLAQKGAAESVTQAVPMILGAASNFSQGWNAQTFDAAEDLPVKRFRDGIRWNEVERSPGAYTFDNPRTTYMGTLGARGARLTLTVNWGNPLYDNGDTPYSDEALAALGKFVAETASRYPAIDTVEVGNEFNSANFVSGRVKAEGLAERRSYHLGMVRSVESAVKAVRPDVKILGGATHSLPAGYLWPLLESGGAQLFDGLAVHPYTTPIDQLAAQIGVLRRNPAARAMPLHVTEFGSLDPDRAGDDLVRAYSAMASLGVREMDWYPLNERGDGHVPLLNRDLSLTSAGKAFRFVQERLARHAGRDLSPDRFTFLHAFGSNIWVVWGASRRVSIDGAAVMAFGATGVRLSPDALALDEGRALVLVGKDRLQLGENVSLACNSLIADSFYQFGYPRQGEANARGDGFERFVRTAAGRALAFETLPGQQRSNVPWTPYLGLANMPQLRLMADAMLPAVGDGGAIVHRYTATSDLSIRLQARFAPSAESADGIGVEVARNGNVILKQSGKGAISIDRRMDLKAGDSLTLAVGPNGTARGDVTDYRIRVLDDRKCSLSR